MIHFSLLKAAPARSDLTARTTKKDVTKGPNALNLQILSLVFSLNSNFTKYDMWSRLALVLPACRAVYLQSESAVIIQFLPHSLVALITVSNVVALHFYIQ